MHEPSYEVGSRLAWRAYGPQVLIEDCDRRVFNALWGVTAFVWCSVAGGASRLRVVNQLAAALPAKDVAEILGFFDELLTSFVDLGYLTERR